MCVCQQVLILLDTNNRAKPQTQTDNHQWNTMRLERGENLPERVYSHPDFSCLLMYC